MYHCAKVRIRLEEMAGLPETNRSPLKVCYKFLQKGFVSYKSWYSHGSHMNYFLNPFLNDNQCRLQQIRQKRSQYIIFNVGIPSFVCVCVCVCMCVCMCVCV